MIAPSRSWRALRVAPLALIGAALAAAEPGESVRGISDLVFGPVMYLVAAIGVLACLYQFARGNKSAVFLGIGGLIFLALSRALIANFYGDAGSPGLIEGGEFPVYGQTDDLSSDSDAVARDYVRAYGYIGLVACNSIIRMMFSFGLPILVAAIFAMWTYKRITVDQKPGSVIGYIISVILLLTFGLVPMVRFAPADLAAVQDSEVVRTVARINDSLPVDAIGDPTRSSLPLAPALLLIAAVDLSEALGRSINREPVGSEMSKIILAARSAQLSPRWLAEYRDYAMHCSAAFSGYVANEHDYIPSGFGASRAELLRERWAEGWLGRVPAAGMNLLSPWGDGVLSMVPVHGYAANDPGDVYAATASDAIPLERDWITSQWVNAYRASGDTRRDRLIFQGASLGHGVHHGVPYAPQVPVPRGQEWKLPFGAARLWSGSGFSTLGNFDGWAIPFCSVPSERDEVFPVLHVRAEDGEVTYQQQSDWRDLPLASRYVEDVFSTVTHGNELEFATPDWGDALRASLLQDYGLDACRQACGHPSHKLYWGCMVTGRFTRLAETESGCASSRATTMFFWDNSAGTSPGYNLQQMLYAGDDIKERHTSRLEQLARAGDPDLFALDEFENYAARLSAVDLILAAPGSLPQVSLAPDVYASMPDGGASMFGFLEQAPALGKWFMGVFVEVAYTLVHWLCAHLIGLTIAGFMALYPLFALFALAPGRWHALLDWGRCMLWVLMWPVVVNLGLAAANAGASETGWAALLSGQPGPGETLMMFVGLSLILMTPAITQIFLLPTLDSLSRVGASVYGTGFRLLGGSNQVATLFTSQPSMAGVRPLVEASQPSPFIATGGSPVGAATGAARPATAAAYAGGAGFVGGAVVGSARAMSTPRPAGGAAIGRAAQMHAAASYASAVATESTPAPTPMAAIVAREHHGEARLAHHAAVARGDGEAAARAAGRASAAAASEVEALAAIGGRAEAAASGSADRARIERADAEHRGA
ncbi:MAG TPA: hypothetical protein VEL07_02970 [Planctomycetota bacterium]|nr:hypothetical protein [Planctomycetota bacterium]